jgi:hypothetical protein
MTSGTSNISQKPASSFSDAASYSGPPSSSASNADATAQKTAHAFQGMPKLGPPPFKYVGRPPTDLPPLPADSTLRSYTNSQSTSTLSAPPSSSVTDRSSSTLAPSAHKEPAQNSSVSQVSSSASMNTQSTSTSSSFYVGLAGIHALSSSTQPNTPKAYAGTPADLSASWSGPTSVSASRISTAIQRLSSPPLYATARDMHCSTAAPSAYKADATARLSGFSQTLPGTFPPFAYSSASQSPFLPSSFRPSVPRSSLYASSGDAAPVTQPITPAPSAYKESVSPPSLLPRTIRPQPRPGFTPIAPAPATPSLTSVKAPSAYYRAPVAAASSSTPVEQKPLVANAFPRPFNRLPETKLAITQIIEGARSSGQSLSSVFRAFNTYVRGFSRDNIRIFYTPPDADTPIEMSIEECNQLDPRETPITLEWGSSEQSAAPRNLPRVQNFQPVRPATTPEAYASAAQFAVSSLPHLPPRPVSPLSPASDMSSPSTSPRQPSTPTRTSATSHSNDAAAPPRASNGPGNQMSQSWTE